MIVSAFKLACLPRHPVTSEIISASSLPAHLRTTQLHPACSLFLSLAISNSCPTDCSLPPSTALSWRPEPDRLLPSWRKSTYFIHSLSPFPAYLSRGAFPSLSPMDGQTTGLNFSENRPRQTATAVAALVFDVVKRAAAAHARSQPPTITPSFEPSVVRPSHE